jgi:hypothetical protein
LCPLFSSCAFHSMIFVIRLWLRKFRMVSLGINQEVNLFWILLRLLLSIHISNLFYMIHLNWKS